MAILYLLCGTGLVSWERRRGVVTVYQTLPLPKGLLARILWSEGVLLFPLIFLVCGILAMPFVWLFGEIVSTVALHDMLIRVLLIVVMGAGYSSICIYIFAAPYAGEQQLTWKSMLYVLLLLGFYYLAVFNGITIMQQKSWSVAFFVAFPAITLLSYLLQKHLLPSYTVSSRTVKKTAPRYSRSNTSFWFQFWARQMGMIAMGLFACVAFSIMFDLFRQRENMIIANPFIILFFLGLMPSALSLGWVSEMRPYRTLPMTAGRLSILLYSIPVMSSLFAAFLVAVVFLAAGMYDSLWQIFTATCFSLGLSSIFFNVQVLYGQKFLVVVTYLLMFALMIGSYTVLVIVPIIGLAISPLLLYQIRNNSEVYHRHSSPARGGYISGR